MRRRLLALLSLAALSQAAEPWEKVCRPVPADSARPGLQECSRLSNDDVRLLVRIKSDIRGMRWSEWSAEKGLHAVHVPDETFWKILDGLAGPQGEWLERDPSSIGKDSILFEAQVGQSFECRNCPGDWLAGTWGPFGASRLLVVRREPTGTRRLPDTVALVPKGTVSDAALLLKSSKPCRDKGGDCTEDRTGPGGARWHLERERSDEGWRKVRVEWDAAPLGDSVSLSQLREDMPGHELRLLLRNWIDAEADLFAANVLAPAPSLFAVTPGDWRRRALRGFRIEAILDGLVAASRVPETVVLYQDATCTAGIRGRTRWMEIRR